MQPSSLIFLVIIGVWAAYFVQYWVRRREHLATVHAVDQFSESMRVLERQAESGVETAPRASSPQTLLKRTAAATVEVEAVAPAAPAPGTVRHGGGRRKRGLAVLTSFVALLISVPVVVLGVAPLAVVAVPVLALVVAVAWVRRGVAAEQAARRAAQRPARQRPQHRPEAVVAASTAAAAAPAASAVEAERTAPEPHGQPEAELQAQARDELYDVQQVEQAYAPPVVEVPEPQYLRPLVDEDDIPLTWDPVPVPRPTYAMKSRVTRPAPTAADLVGDADTEYADAEHAAYEDEEPTRRVAGA